MAYSTTNLYPEDLNGTNPLNLITNEIHNLQPPGPKDFYFIIPFAAPFFVDSLEVYNVATGAKYVEGDDYLVGHRFIEAMDSIGRPIAGSIRFLRFDIVGQVRLRYRTIGGQWGFSDQAILAELARVHLNPLRRSWGDIDVLPYSFPPFEHDQSLDTLVGSKELKAALDHIAAIMEATASGTTESHLVDYNNPHRVTKQQVMLGNVPNFSMATDEQAIASLRNDLFMNPRGTLLSIQEHALKPLNAHINATGNVHNMVPADIGLGNVPNYPAATPAQAIDPTNTTTLLTPYTGALLVQKLANDPRLDQLIIDFNNHLTAHNPHGITPAMIGTLTTQEIEQRIAQGSGGGGGDADTFGGLTPSQWEAKFPVNADINQMLTETGDIYLDKLTAINAVDMTDPITPEIIARRNATKVSWAFGGYAAYGIYNSLAEGRIVSSSSTIVGDDSFSKETFADAANRWSSDKNANYFIEGNGSLQVWGSEAVKPPAGYLSESFNPANASKIVKASKDYVWLVNASNKLFRFDRAGTTTPELPSDEILDLIIGNGLVDPRPVGVAETGTDWNNVTIKPIGDASWISAFNVAMVNLPVGQKYHDSRIASEYINLITYTGNVPDPNDPNAVDNRVYFLHIYKINYNAAITLTEVTNQIDIKNHTTNEIVKADTIRGVTQVAGSYTHFVFTKPRPNSTLCDLLSYGDNSQGQLEMLPTSAPFLSIAAGYQYTVTINRQNFVEFWGNSEDNSLFYRGGAFIPSPGTVVARPGAN
ncbi:virion structural protein [Pseudomonas phage Phabio]|uniref:Virion structural protein n=1 Tax=Pseudomonas phage Phabio TaxID=2006668 RepID=A0A1Y0SW83_9CAUD|nr:tail protein [Pseudomonas phage Phabio]ARV76834.1 virion structural protein [Pseudomonas phage Phabio]